MAIFKCKMCGGDLEIAEGMSVAECQYCGTKQTIPNADNEKKVNLFNRANRLRFGNEFDKAAGIYESITAEFPEESEAYWGLCLCKYGIEYVDDSTTARKIPTCHRTSYESIFEDSNFDLALEYAQPEAVQLYRSEAKEIDRLQKAILEIANNEEPFDIFICYKETDDSGERTKDSVLAQDIYDALIAKGYKVFFSRITLEDKLGQEYEPYIFSALNSAKVMLAVGTRYEYYNAVWVKNEWSRFLEMMKNNREKALIPCYCDLDAYDMPKEFKNFQGQDMSKIGFMQDLVRGVGKLLNPDSSIPAKEPVTTSVVAPGVDSLLKRVFIFLEDSDWDSANRYSEKVLDIDPENSHAYLGKLMAELHAKDEDSLMRMKINLNEYDNYRKIKRFADEPMKQKLKLINDNIMSIFNEDTYNRATENMEKLMKSTEWYKMPDYYYKEVVNLFQTIPEYKDSLNKIDECKKFLYQTAVEKIKTGKPYDAVKLLTAISDYKDSQQLIEKCELMKEEIPTFNTAKGIIKKYHPSVEDLQTALKKFESVQYYTDVSRYIDLCKRMLEVQKVIEPIEKNKNKLGVFQIKEKKELQTHIDKLYKVIWDLQLEI